MYIRWKSKSLKLYKQIYETLNFEMVDIPGLTTRQNNFLVVGGAQKIFFLYFHDFLEVGGGGGQNIKFSLNIIHLQSIVHLSWHTVPVGLNDELILHLCQAVFVPRSLVMVFMPIIRLYEQRWQVLASSSLYQQPWKCSGKSCALRQFS